MLVRTLLTCQSTYCERASAFFAQAVITYQSKDCWKLPSEGAYRAATPCTCLEDFLEAVYELGIHCVACHVGTVCLLARCKFLPNSLVMSFITTVCVRFRSLAKWPDKPNSVSGHYSELRILCLVFEEWTLTCTDHV